jgi:hypothetical protein
MTGLRRRLENEQMRFSSSARIVFSFSFLVAFNTITTVGSSAPKIWDETALQDWATPIAALNVRPAHYTPAEYYAVAGSNLRTYPVYRPDKEPPGYWESLQHKHPEPLVDASQIHTQADWIAAGERAFRELDVPVTRSDDPALIATARDPKSFEKIIGLADGTINEPRWVVTDRGVMLSNLACATCHFSVTADRQIHYATPIMVAPGVGPTTLTPVFAQLGQRLAKTMFGDGGMDARFRRLFAVPWMPDEVERLQRLAAQPNALSIFFSPHGVIPRENGSPFYGTRVPDLHLLRYSHYIDATGTHRIRGPADVGRYAALISGADADQFGSYGLRSADQVRVPMRFADEVLYAIGSYLVSLEPPQNPNPPSADLVKRGEQVFQREKCGVCHPAPAYTTGELTPALGFVVPRDHPNLRDVRNRSVGTDPGLSLRTRKGTGFYKIPSLRGLWYRPRLLHDASITTLEELFDAVRLSPDYERKGWSPPGVTKGAVPGLEFLTTLSAEDKTALIAFLRSL